MRLSGGSVHKTDSMPYSVDTNSNNSDGGKIKEPLLNFKTEEQLVDLSNNSAKAKETPEDVPSEPPKSMKVKPGWGNIRIAKEALKAYGIENPTKEQLQKVQAAIEEANADQVKVWTKDNNPNLPKGTKYFYANANIKIPDLNEVLGTQEPGKVEDIEKPDEPSVLTPIDNPQEVTPQSPEDTKPEQDCVISNPTKQSDKTNDCWLLSGTNALMNTSWGREAINESIKKDENGNVTVTLKGADNKQIQVSPEEIEQAKASGLYSEGDDNMIALEIAINKYKDELHPQTDVEREHNGLQINWGEGYELFHLITGKKVARHSGIEPIGYSHPDYVNKGLNVEKALDTIRDNPDEAAMVVSFRRNDGSPFEKFVVDGVEISPKHAYSVAGVEKGTDGKEYVILVNPRNSGEKIKISRESFIEHLDAADAIANNDDTLQVDQPNLSLLENINLPESL